MPLRVALVAGEHSGDQLGFKLIRALREASSGQVVLSGVGGEAMEAAVARARGRHARLLKSAGQAMVGDSQVAMRDLVNRGEMRPTLKVVPNGLNLQSENPSPCSIPLLEAQIPKDIHFTIRQFRPRPDQLGPMPTVKVPAPACDAKK